MNLNTLYSITLIILLIEYVYSINDVIIKIAIVFYEILVTISCKIHHYVTLVLRIKIKTNLSTKHVITCKHIPILEMLKFKS